MQWIETRNVFLTSKSTKQTRNTGNEISSQTEIKSVKRLLTKTISKVNSTAQASSQFHTEFLDVFPNLKPHIFTTYNPLSISSNEPKRSPKLHG